MLPTRSFRTTKHPRLNFSRYPRRPRILPTRQPSDLPSVVFSEVNRHYRNDFRLFWLRTNFFLVVNAGLFGIMSSGFYPEHHQTLSLGGVALFAQGLSILWFLTTRSALTWIDVWRDELVEIDSKVNPFSSFARGERERQARDGFHLRYRPETVASFLPLLFQFLWSWIVFAPFIRSFLRQLRLVLMTF